MGERVKEEGREKEEGLRRERGKEVAENGLHGCFENLTYL